MTQRRNPRDLRAGLAEVYGGNADGVNTGKPGGLAEAPATSNLDKPDVARLGGAPALYVAEQKQGLLVEIEELRTTNARLKRQGTADFAPDDIEDFWPSDRLPEAFADVAFLTLLASLREHGQDQPIIVRPHPEKSGRYQIACGRRRREACRQLGITVKTLVRQLDDDELLQIMLRENEEREDLSLYERAAFIRAMQAKTSLSVRGLARRLELSAGYVSRLARLPELDPQLRQLIGDPRPLTMRTLETLAELFDHDETQTSERLERVMAGWGSLKPAAESEARARQIIKLARGNVPAGKPLARDLRSIENRVLGQLKSDARGRRWIELAPDLDRHEVERLLQAIETTRLGKECV